MNIAWAWTTWATKKLLYSKTKQLADVVWVFGRLQEVPLYANGMREFGHGKSLLSWKYYESHKSTEYSGSMC